MSKLYLLAVVLIFLLDVLILILTRQLLFDFLRGHTSRRRARRIRREQTWKDKILLGYLVSYITDKDDAQIFKRYYMLYRVCLLGTLPQYALLAVGNCFLHDFPQIVFICVGFIAVTKLVLFLIVRLPSLLYRGNYVSKYAYKKGNRKK